MKIIISLILSLSTLANLNVVTTTTNLASVAQFIGGDLVTVSSLAKGSQDPHFLEAKPSYTFKLAKADLLISVGADLEVGWLPLIVRGSRNPNLRVGSTGRLVAGSHVVLIKETQDIVSRSQGDVHPLGNPHFMLAPSNSIKIAKVISDRFSQLDPANSKAYQNNLNTFKTKMEQLIAEMKKVIKEGMPIVTYHRTLTYFLSEFGVKIADVLEPKPGIPPTASHIIDIIKLVKAHKIKKILVENYYDMSVAGRVKKSVPSLNIYNVAVAVQGSRDTDDIFKLYRHIAKALE